MPDVFVNRPRWYAVLALLTSLAVLGCGSDEERVARGPEGGDDATVTENHPGNLVITAPARASFIPENAEGLIEVTGSGATDALEVNGQRVTPAEDGSFATVAAATVGVNVLRVVDGESAIDTPFVYGRFASPSDPVAAAVAVRINALGFDDPDPDKLSLTLLANRALDDVNVLAALDGQTFSGSVAGADWTFEVEKTSYDGANVTLSPRAGGAAFEARVENLQVDGTLSVEVFGVGPSGHVTLTADRAVVDGDLKVWLDEPKIAASAPAVTTTLENFQYDSNNAGFPCCVDDIMTGFLRPKVQDAAQEKVQQTLSKQIAFALSQFSLPQSFDLSSAGFEAMLDLDEAFDGASFDAEGGRLTAAVHIHHDIAETDPGAAAPGWLTVSQKPATMAHDVPFGVSVSLDTINQALFAAWAQNGLSRTLEDVPSAGTVELSPRLPPIVIANPEGGLLAAAGEVVIDARILENPVQAAVTIVDELEVTVDPVAQKLVLSPAPAPRISITWLVADGLNDGLRKTIEATILDKLPSLLTPVSLPLPSLPLGSIASSFGDAVGALGPASTIAVDPQTHRLALYGDLDIVQ